MYENRDYKYGLCNDLCVFILFWFYVILDINFIRFLKYERFEFIIF